MHVSCLLTFNFVVPSHTNSALVIWFGHGPVTNLMWAETWKRACMSLHFLSLLCVHQEDKPRWAWEYGWSSLLGGSQRPCIWLTWSTAKPSQSWIRQLPSDSHKSEPKSQWQGQDWGDVSEALALSAEFKGAPQTSEILIKINNILIP